jgi:hypothetical protein
MLVHQMQFTTIDSAPKFTEIAAIYNDSILGSFTSDTVLKIIK